MTVDFDKILDDLHSPVKDYSGIPQMLQGRNQEDMPKEEIIYPHFRYYFSEPYDQNQFQPYVEKVTVSSDDPEFESDVLYRYILHPHINLTIEAYGDLDDDVITPINKAHNWFKIAKLGRRFLRDSDYDISVVNVLDIVDRTSIIEEDYQKRLGFDVVLDYKEVIEVTEKTIESVEITGPDGQVKIDL